MAATLAVISLGKATVGLQSRFVSPATLPQPDPGEIQRKMG